jgi:thiol-disulfide isomerase/thioredoxin
MAKSKNNKSQVEEKNVESSEEEESTLYYFYSVGCGFCKKAEPIIDELIKEGHDILKLDTAVGDNAKLKIELEKEYGGKCGTPFFIDAETGNSVCGFREKDILEKWAKGEEIPAPPRPKSPPPKLPFHGASEKEIKTWKKEYEKWKEENSHLPNLQEANQILTRPRPKSDPPAAPQANWNDEQKKDWSADWDEWRKENDHLPNLQPAETILSRLSNPSAPPTPPNQISQDAIQDYGDIKNEVKTLKEQVGKLEKNILSLMNHLGVRHT